MTMATFIHTSRGLLNLDHVVLIKQGVAREAGENYVQLADGRILSGIILDPIPGLPVTTPAATTPRDQDQLPPADEPKTAVGRWDG
jgi:hypothetical protein